MSETNTRQPARPRWLTAERSEPSGRMRGIEPNNKRNVVFPSSVLPSRRFGNPPFPEGEGLIGCVHDCHLVALVEKSPATETARYIYAPAHLPAAAHRREIPRNRNDDTRTRITDQANTLNTTVIARSAATWQSPGREDLLANTDKNFSRGGFLHCVRTSSSLRSK